MARRFRAAYLAEPYSSLATWARRLAVFAAVVAVVSIIVVRFGFLEVRPALATFVGALFCAGLSIVVSLAAFAAIWQSGARGLGRVAAALLLSLLVLAYPAYLAYQYHQVPAIYDITTDPIDPPRFDVLARLRTGDGTNPAVYAGLYAAEQQRQAYPDIEPVQLDVSVQRAYDATLHFVTRRKWRIVDARPPQPPRREGHIEAVARTPLMGLREDVAIRILPSGDGARIDIRSSSRHFESDLGSNAARITALIADLNTISDENTAPVKPPAAKAQAKGAKK
ncbi:MAG TPA: DUF1499 domain-containing protein [Xanthobacteraceae bacterium]|nr:DUF1499 domain-containing protein [Xanthobacteraceae bacterium]